MGCGVGLTEVHVDQAVDRFVLFIDTFSSRLLSGPAVVRLTVAEPLNLLDEDECLGRLEMRELRGAEGIKVVPVCGEVGARVRGDERDDFLAPPFARPSHHQGVSDARMCAQHFLDLFDEHLFATGVHHQRIAAEKADGAVLFQGRPVAGDHHPLAVDLRKGPFGWLRDR